MSRAGRSLAALALALLAATAVGAADAATRPRFDGALALRHVERLVALGPRPAGSPAAERARDYIVAQLKRAGAEVRVEAFDADTPHGRLRMTNVIGVLPGRRSDVILVGGHYDTKWFRDIRFVGANDGGSSTALLLELARVLGAAPRDFTYWITFFDGEEARETWTPRDSLYGSRHMAAALQRANRLPRAVIVADMIGDRHLDIRQEQMSTRWLTRCLWAAAERLRYQTHFLDQAQTVEDDHLPFQLAGVPSVLLIDFNYPPWHTEADTLDKVSADSLRVVGEVLLDALPFIEAKLVHEPGGGDECPRSSTAR